MIRAPLLLTCSMLDVMLSALILKVEGKSRASCVLLPNVGLDLSRLGPLVIGCSVRR